MTKQTYLNRIKKIADRWQALLQLEGWTITHSVVNDLKAFGCTDETVAINDSSWSYRDSKIRWSLKYANSGRPMDLEEYVLHEIMHVMVNEMRMWAINPDALKTEVADLCLNHEERVVDQLTKAIMNVFKNGKN